MHQNMQGVPGAKHSFQLPLPHAPLAAHIRLPPVAQRVHVHVHAVGRPQARELGVDVCAQARHDVGGVLARHEAHADLADRGLGDD